jgi:hypothetical protein
VTLIGPEAARASVREVSGELLVRAGVATSWAAQASFRSQDLFAAAQDNRDDAVGVWIDLSSSSTAHLYFRDAGSKWFVIRSLPLPGGRRLDEIAREEIGHIVATAVVALGTGTGKALTRSEARAALETQSVSIQVATPPATSGPPPRLALAPWATAQLFAPQKATTGFLGLSVAMARGPRWGQGPGRLGAWLDVGYQIAGGYNGERVGADIHTTSLRAGLLWDIRRLRAVLLRVGLGGGIDHVTYRPRGESTNVDLAAAGRFLIPEVCLWGGVELRATEHLALSLRALADLALVRVHYDVDSGDGQRRQVLVPYLVRPGLSLGAALLF